MHRGQQGSVQQSTKQRTRVGREKNRVQQGGQQKLAGQRTGGQQGTAVSRVGDRGQQGSIQRSAEHRMQSARRRTVINRAEDGVSRVEHGITAGRALNRAPLPHTTHS